MSVSSRLRWNKIRGMSLAEVAARASETVFLAIERRRIGAAGGKSFARPSDVTHNWREAIEQRRQHSCPVFFPGLQHSEAMRALFSADGPYAAQASLAQRAASAAKRHHFEFFGQRFTYGDKVDWHADPLTRRRWPRVFHRDVPIHDGRAIGDVKFVWELNRHQFLIDLGKAYWLFADDAAASSVYSIVRDWIRDNPYGIGVNWSCALEPAFRAWSWLWAYHFCAGDPKLDDDTHALWLGSFYEHGHFLYRHLEHYSSPFNHLIGEASALYALGLLFPEMPEAERWRKRGRRVLETRVSTEFHADGGSVEQSTFYHHATLGFYILAALTGEANGDPFPSAVHTAIEKGIEFSMTLMQPDGRLPSIGGADDGKCIRLEQRPFWDFRPFQAIGAVRYRRGDFRFAADEFFEDALWLLGPSGRDRFLAIEPTGPPSSTALPASGYYVLRSGSTAEPDYLCFDCGEQAAGLRRDSVPSAAHGHADCLSVVLWLRGRPVFVDPGFFCYNGDPDWELHFRRTRAHNTALVDGRDQSLHVHKMAWTQVFAPNCEVWLPGEWGGAVGGSHDGYAREIDGVIHRRAAWLHESGYCIICDQFSGEGTHQIEINYQFAPGSARLSGESAVLFDNAELAWSASTRIEGRVRCGEADPEGGWIAPSLGVKVAAPRLTLHSTFETPAMTCLSLVFPRSGEERRSIVKSSIDGLLAIGVETATGGVDWFGMPVRDPAVSARELVASLVVWTDHGVTAASPVPVLEHRS